jgi:inorganic triphosphatase YgiF
MDPHREIELKLEASPEDLRRLQRHPLVHSLSQARAVTQRLESVYFDTEEHDLASARFGLRVRRVGIRRVQTVKGERSATGGLFERTEFEIPLHGDQPNIARVSDPQLRERLFEIIDGKPLVEVFRTEFRRTRRVLRKGESEWTLDVDDGRIVAGDRSASVHEVELELREGDPARLFEFALLLQERLDLRPSARSKAERGYALARGEGAAAQTSRRVRLESDATLEQAFAAILSHCLAHFTVNADCACEGLDPEGVHQMRVGVRRARAALGLFEDLLPPDQLRHFRSELRWLARELGAARDLDVFTRGILAEIEALRAGVVALERLRAEAVVLRAECYEGVRAVIGSRRYARLVLELGGWISARAWQEYVPGNDSLGWLAPARGFAEAELERRHRKIGRLAGKLDESDAERHEVRIELKKLRYASEFLRGLYPGHGAKRFLRRIARVQSALGHMNDVVTAQRILATLLSRLGPERTREHDRAAGFVEGWAAQFAANALRETADAWTRLEHARPFSLERPTRSRSPLYGFPRAVLALTKVGRS